MNPLQGNLQILSYYDGAVFLTVTKWPNQHENDMMCKVLTHSVLIKCVLCQRFDLIVSDKNRNIQMIICTNIIILK